MQEYEDSARAVRQGEALDTEKLASYLKQHLPQFNGELVIEQFPGGHSNLTYLLRIGVQEIVLRRPPFGSQVKTAHDMGREYKVLAKLAEVYPIAPKPYLYCEDTQVIGANFYIMERRKGIILRQNVPKAIVLAPEAVQHLCHAFIDNLATLHQVDYQQAGLTDLGHPQGYVRRQVEGWTKRYYNAQTEKIPLISEVITWLAQEIPPEVTACLIHNDYKYDNLVLDAANITHILALLDWEMCTVGDPLMDLGTTLGYWEQAGDEDRFQFRGSQGINPTRMSGSLTRQELVGRYAEKTNSDVSQMLFYYVFGLFKIAVIIQQIYYRYAKGYTQDARFADFNTKVALLAKLAAEAINANKY